MKIVFSASRGISGAVIRMMTYSRWNHVDVLLPDGKTVIGATSKGVQLLTLNERLHESHIKRYKIDQLDLPNEEGALSFLKEQIGKPYDFGGCFGTVFRDKHWDSEDKWFCSELVVAVAFYGGRQMVRGSPSRVTPSDLEQCPYLSPFKEEVML